MDYGSKREDLIDNKVTSQTAPSYFESLTQSIGAFFTWNNTPSSQAQQPSAPTPAACAATGKPVCQCSKSRPKQ